MRQALALLAACAVSIAACQGNGADEPASTTAPAAPTSPPCVSSLVPGVTSEVRETPEGERIYQLAVPDGVARGIIFDFHGTGGTIEVQDAITQLSTKGTARGFIVVTPQGLEKPTRWTVPGIPGPDDVAFVEALEADLRSAGCVEGPAIATGKSSGAAMTAQLACESPAFSAFAPVGGVNLYRRCPDGAAVSVISFHGTDDLWVPYEGPDGWEDVEAQEGAYFIGDVRASITSWSDRGGCGPVETTTVGDDTYIETYDCPSGDLVSLYTIDGGGHTHPGTHAMQAYEELGATESVGTTTESFDGTDVMLDFFEQVMERKATR